MKTILRNIIELPSANMILMKFQRFCGVSADGKINYLVLHYYFKLSSTLGEEIFSLIPLLFWFSFRYATVFMTNFGITLVCGQILKDILKLPRPTAKGDNWVISKLERHFETEYGFPSTHTMSGFLPASVALAVSRDGYPLSHSIKISCTVYVISLALSRLYLGVHSVLDVIGGVLIGVFSTFLLAIFGDTFNIVVYEKDVGLAISLSTLLLFATVYPRATPWRASYGTAAQIYGS